MTFGVFCIQRRKWKWNRPNWLCLFLKGCDRLRNRIRISFFNCCLVLSIGTDCRIAFVFGKRGSKRNQRATVRFGLGRQTSEQPGDRSSILVFDRSCHRKKCNYQAHLQIRRGVGSAVAENSRSLWILARSPVAREKNQSNQPQTVAGILRRKTRVNPNCHGAMSNRRNVWLRSQSSAIKP